MNQRAIKDKSRNLQNKDTPVSYPPSPPSPPDYIYQTVGSGSSGSVSGSGSSSSSGSDVSGAVGSGAVQGSGSISGSGTSSGGTAIPTSGGSLGSDEDGGGSGPGTDSDSDSDSGSGSDSDNGGTNTDEDNSIPDDSQINPVLGCLNYNDCGNCTQCNSYSELDFENQLCMCTFNYTISIDESISTVNDTNVTEYKMIAKTMLNYTADIDLPEGQVAPCNEFFLFIFEDFNAIENYAGDVDGLLCRFDRLQPNTCGKKSNETQWTTQVTISNASESFVRAFVLDLIEIAFQYSQIELDCIGIADILMTYKGIDCKEGQEICQRPLQGGEGGICSQNYNITFVNDQSQLDANSITVRLWDILYYGDYQEASTNKIVCSDVFLIQANSTAIDWLDEFLSETDVSCYLQTYTNIIQLFNNGSEIAQYVSDLYVANITDDLLQGFLNYSYYLVLSTENFNTTDLCTFDSQYHISNQNSTIVTIPRCQANCTVCVSGSGDCEICNDGFIRVLQNESYTCIPNPCNSDELYNEADNSCYTCPVGCANCSSDGFCYQCARDYYQIGGDQANASSAICIKICPTDQFTDWFNKRCTICDPDCSECQQNPNYLCSNSSQVAFCNKNRNANNDLIVQLAENDTISNDTAVPVSDIQCLDECPLGYYAQNGWCKKCKGNCLNCTSYDDCSDCQQPYKLVDSNCVPKFCTDSHSFIDTSGTCQECAFICETCSQKKSFCTNCKFGWAARNGVCLPFLGSALQSQAQQLYQLQQTLTHIQTSQGNQ